MHFNRYKAAVSCISDFCQQYHIDLQEPSHFALENLFYILGKGQLNVRFPFNYEFPAFDGYLILTTIEGEGKITTDQQEFFLPAEKVLFISCRSSIHLDLCKYNNWNFHFIFIGGNSIHAYYELFHSGNYFICSPNPISPFPHILDELLSYTVSNSTGELIVSKLITDLLTELMISKTSELDHTVSLPKYLVQIKNQFDNDFSEHFNLDELAETYHVSKYKIIRDFTTHLHTSPINYLINKRITVAKKLLRDTEYPVYEVASRVGIDNINHFTNLFKRATKLTPVNYRKSSRDQSTPPLNE